jgi:hypothetical protein
LFAPWTVAIDRSNGFPFVDPKRVHIANPASFPAHKALIHSKRGKAAKDILSSPPSVNWTIKID